MARSRERGWGHPCYIAILRFGDSWANCESGESVRRTPRLKCPWPRPQAEPGYAPQERCSYWSIACKSGGVHTVPLKHGFLMLLSATSCNTRKYEYVRGIARRACE